MSASRVAFHERPLQLVREAPPRPMEADTRRVSRASEDAGDLTWVEPFPGRQREQLAILGPQPRERRADVALDARLGAGARRDPRLFAEPARQPEAAPLGSALVREHAPRDPVQPQPRLLAVRNVAEPAPGRRERLCDDIRRVRRLGSTPCIAENQVVVGLVEAPEPLARAGCAGQTHRAPLLCARHLAAYVRTASSVSARIRSWSPAPMRLPPRRRRSPRRSPTRSGTASRSSSGGCTSTAARRARSRTPCARPTSSTSRTGTSSALRGSTRAGAARRL